MRNAYITFKKQCKDTFRNKTVLIQFVLYPFMTLVMENLIQIDNMPEHFFVTLFSSMFLGMAPLTSTAAIIAEEKEKGTLRALMMSSVKAWEYLLGSGCYVLLLCLIGSALMGAAAGYQGLLFITYMAAMGIGIVISAVFGATIGMLAESQMAATSLQMPAMLVLAFAPMLAFFNESIEKVARILFTEQIYSFIVHLDCGRLGVEQLAFVVLNFSVGCICFGLAYRKSFV